MTTILNTDSDYSSLNDYIDDIMDSNVNDVEVNVLSHDRKPSRYRAAENHGPRRFYTVTVEAQDGTQYSETLQTSDLIEE
ncbi:MAG: hypothetical protein SVU32_08190, partial [Candidatus Nanohaloarchaea archaeon]|nr:hypothetical protein [Candidatus Nanohaloarchaea archaeon]